MKSQATLSEGVILGLGISVVSAVFFMGMISLLPGGFVFRILITLISLFYIIYLFSRHSEKTGKITISLGWVIISVLNHVLTDSTLLFITIHISMIWLVRSLYFYNSLWSSALDFALSFLALLASVLTWDHTSSLLLSIWSFFLVQSLFVFIPKQLNTRTSKTTPKTIHHSFEQACQQAQIALQRLKTYQSSNRR